MKKITLSFLLLITNTLIAQITYNSTDFASVNEQFTVSSISTGLNSFNFTTAGPNTSWNFSTLGLASQEMVAWLNPNNTGYKSSWCLSNGFLLNCNTQFNNAFNLAIKSANGIQIQGFGLTNINNHYKLSTATLENKMLGATITAGGVSVPFAVNYTIPDIEYRFPIFYNDTYTTNSSFTIDLNSLGVSLQYTSVSNRTNTVEGWGSMVTPFASFSNVLKMKTVVINNNTTVSNGQTIPTTITTITYKWFDVNYGIPVLEVSGQEVSGQFVATSAHYVDSQRCLTPTALFAYLPVVNDYDAITQSSVVSFINTSLNYDIQSWEFGDGTMSADLNPVHTYTCPGTKAVKLTVTNIFCDPDQTDTVTIPVVITDSQNAFTTGVTISPTSLTADRTLAGTTYQWIDCSNNSPIAGATSQTYSPLSSGNYKVSLTTNGCQSISQCYNFSFLNNADFDLQNQLVLYPNPTEGKLTISNPTVDIKNLSIYNTLGMLVSNTLDLSNQPSGLYLVIITAKNNEVFKRTINKK
jgi:PKD repeat protein